MGRVGRKSRLSKKAKRGFRGYPVATLAFYGPNAEFASKIAVGIVQEEDGEPDMHHWHATGPVVRADREIEAAVLDPSWLHLASARGNNELPRLLAARQRLRSAGPRGLHW